MKTYQIVEIIKNAPKKIGEVKMSDEQANDENGATNALFNFVHEKFRFLGSTKIVVNSSDGVVIKSAQLISTSGRKFLMPLTVI